MKQIYVKQVRSTARTKESQLRTLRALGLGRLGKHNVIKDSSPVRGMIRQVLHWLEVKHV